jgi:NAD(P) transhydrogenase subunit alpha
MALAIATLTERDPGETRVALVPSGAKTWVEAGCEVLVEAGAGVAAEYPDADYVAAGATVVSRAQVLSRADVVVTVNRPAPDVLEGLREGQLLLGLLDAWDTDALQEAADRGVHVLSLDRLPRRISRAQTMDVLSSQGSLAGYRAVIVAAEAYGRFFPMMVTAAGTAKPASVLVLGAGVAGLQAIATARRLGARVTGYDVRPAAREEISSLGAQFLDTSVSAADDSGYARELTEAETATQQQELAVATRRFDIVITTAKVPGLAPPVLVTAETVAAMKRGSVIIDMGAGPLGGNVVGSIADATTVTDNGVTLIGAGNLPATAAAAASDSFSRNISAVLSAVIKDGELIVDATDDVIGALLVAPDVTHELNAEGAHA